MISLRPACRVLSSRGLRLLLWCSVVTVTVTNCAVVARLRGSSTTQDQTNSSTGTEMAVAPTRGIEAQEGSGAANYLANNEIAAIAPPTSDDAPAQVSAESAIIETQESDDDVDEACESCEAVTDEAEAEVHDTGTNDDHTVRYTADLDDAELERRFVNDLPSLGSISVGFADEGRLINPTQMPKGDAWEVVVPDYAWGTDETIAAIATVANTVREHLPQAGALRVNHISKKDGGYARPHRSHQSGRDVDFGLFYKGNASPVGMRGSREKLIEPAYNWELIRALVTQSDVQLILVDHRIQKVISDYAVSIGEDKAWVSSLFVGPTAIVKHARRHRDHFHVRFFSPRSQELGRRTQPLLAKRPDENIVSYRVRSGDTLGHIARRYGSTIGMIQKANHMKSSFLRLSRVLAIPLRGPCTRCPLPAPCTVPPRRLPPEGLSPRIVEVVAPPAATPPQVAPDTPSPTAETPAVEVPVGG